MGLREKPFTYRPFPVDLQGDVATEHRIIGEWADAAAGLVRNYYEQADLKSHPAGQKILEASPEHARRLVLAAALQLQHIEREVGRLRALADDHIERANLSMHPSWDHFWGRARQVSVIPTILLRRALPLTAGDLLAILQWLELQSHLSPVLAPIGAIVKSVERFASKQPLSDELAAALRHFAGRLRSEGDTRTKRLATQLEQLVGYVAGDTTSEPQSSAAQPINPALAGDSNVLVQLKQHLDLLPVDDQAVEEVVPDRFKLRVDSPLHSEHALLTAVYVDAVGKPGYHTIHLDACAPGRAILQLEPKALGRVLLAAAERDIAALLYSQTNYDDHAGWQSRYAANSVAQYLLRRKLVFDRAGLFDLVLYLSARPSLQFNIENFHLLDKLEAIAADSPLTEGERYALALYRTSRIQGPLFGSTKPEIARLTQIIGDEMGFYLTPDEHWTMSVNIDIHAMPPDQRSKWITILKHWLTATASRPSDKWIKACEKLVAELGSQNVRDRLLAWLRYMPAGKVHAGVPGYTGDTRSGGDVIMEENANILRGMLWTMAAFGNNKDELVRVISTVAQSAYKKVPGVGPRAVKVGNAAIYALSEIGNEAAVGQLAMLKVRVKFGTAQKEIEKAFNAAAEKLGLPRDQIEELGVPTYGLEEVGVRTETFGDATATLRVDGSDVAIQWTSGGKAVKSVPAKVKAEFKDELKELQGAVKDIAGMLPAQSARLDSMFLLEKRWPIARWRERYLDHPLVGTLARRLVWSTGGRSIGWLNGALVDADDQPVTLSDDAEIALWHPIGRPTDEVLAWRAWTQRHEIVQPFKQAHREIYLLTDAERRTNTYSNRFAAHVLRQHQFNALCAARGWKNKLRLMVDDAYPPASRDLPQWGLRAEYWIEGIGEDYGTDTLESGAYIRVATDQVRFYRTGAATNYAHAGGGGYALGAAGPGEANVNEPLPLDQIPPLVFSEILRDVDLFVGVASVGNDPAWQDGGPGGRYRDYWQSYSFGDLSETAKTRKAVLETLLPRLTKLKGRWTLTDKFLVVRGDLRTYKIHLGSGNILMEPNDQYLCIVADRSAKQSGDVFLPFEGDATLSIILSKAFLLAADTKITDETITRQIK